MLCLTSTTHDESLHLPPKHIVLLGRLSLEPSLSMITSACRGLPRADVSYYKAREPADVRLVDG